VTARSVERWLAQLERRLAAGGEEELAEILVSLAFVAGQAIELTEDERRAAARRALVLLAAGGDPARGLDLHGRPVSALAADLDAPERRLALERGIVGLIDLARPLPHVHEALRGLLREPDIAWRAYAAAILAEELDA
jgi:hypothetical protein